MSSAQDLLWTLSLVLCVAAATSLLFQRLRQPVVLGYLLAGLLIGPHLPLPLLADQDTVHTLSELGVILLMFSIGLEFDLRRLLRLAPTSGLVGALEIGTLLSLGYLASRAFGWTLRESLFGAAVVAISSTTIVAKSFQERPVDPALRRIVFGVLIIEDLVAVLLIAALTSLGAGRGVSAGALVFIFLRLIAFLGGLLLLGLLLVPRLIRGVQRLDRPETTLVTTIGICFGLSLLVRSFGYSVALGAFLAGSLVAESGHADEIERLVRPVRDVFAAIFFVAVGMQIDPALVAGHLGEIAVFGAVVVGGKLLGVGTGVFLTGRGVRMAVRSGMSLAQIGEFSFIMIAIGVQQGVAREFLYAVVVGVSAFTALLTPWLIRASDPVAKLVDRTLPPPLQTFVTLYGSWVEQIRSAPADGAGVRALGRRLLLEAVALAAWVIGASLWLSDIGSRLTRVSGLPVAGARAVVVAAAVLIALPFAIGIVRLARRLGLALARAALPPAPSGELDLAAAPRRVLVLALQLGCLLVVGIPLVAVTQPFVPLSALALGIVVVGVGAFFWRSATNLQGHVRAGAEIISEALAGQARAPQPSIDAVQPLLSGLGEPIPVRLPPGAPVIGRSLGELDLRGLIGATVLAIQRGSDHLTIPSSKEVLREGDLLAITGSHEAIGAARALLLGAPLSEPPSGAASARPRSAGPPPPAEHPPPSVE